MRIGILTGGGDCPGLNAALRAVVRTTEETYGGFVVGYRHGWRGVAEGDSVELTGTSTHAILAAGGTVLGTSRFHPEDHEGAVGRVVDTLRRDHIGALVVLGGDGSLAAARPIVASGIPVVGVPKTIDNDVLGTDACIGFDTALTTATDAIDRIHTTAESHDRVMIVEVMGHRAGWLAVCAGIAGGAHAILTPEQPFDIDQVAASIRHRHRRDNFSIVVVAEGATPVADGPGPAADSAADSPDPSTSLPSSRDPVAGAVGSQVRADLSRLTGFESRLVVLGHLQRGGVPSAADRLLATRLGVAAVEAVQAGHVDVMVGLVGGEIAHVDLATATSGTRPVPDALLAVARALCG